MNVTLQELLHAINILGEDRDVVIDGFGEFAVCPPCMLTAAGRGRFRKALSAHVEVEYENSRHQSTYVSDNDEDTQGEAMQLLVSLSGGCGEKRYIQWFQDDDAEII